MPTISLAVSEVIKRRLFRTREHLQCLKIDDVPRENILKLARSSYELTRALNLPAVKHIEGDGESAQPIFTRTRHAADILTNLTTVIDFDLTQLALTRDPEEVVLAAGALLAAVQEIPLPPPARS